MEFSCARLCPMCCISEFYRKKPSSAKKRKMSLETIGDPDDLKKLVKTSLDCLDTGPDKGTCEDALMPILAENGTSSPEQDVSPDQKEEAKVNTESSFRKTLRNISCLQALELPATFVKEHGHNFKSTVSLQGPSGRVTSVCLSIKSYSLQDRVHFAGADWRDFVVENGFKAGHQLLFSLVSMSTFTVRLVEIPVSPAPAKIKRRSPSTRQHHHSNNVPTSIASVCLGMCPPNLPEMGSKEKANDVSLPANVKNDVVYGHRTLAFKQEVEPFLENLRCPHFVTIVGKSNLREHRSSSLNVPVEFQKKYGAYFSKFNFFQGPSGRMMEVCFSGTAYDRFAKGWKPFHKENGIKLGDVLLFSLRAPACWLVQVVESRQSEELTTGGELCDIEDRK